MRFKNCTLAYAKALYMKKYEAQQENNQQKLEDLKSHYPELFDNKFLMDIIKNEFERAKLWLDNNMIMKNYLFQYQ